VFHKVAVADMDGDGRLLLRFDSNAWNSTITFSPDALVLMHGVLELDFALGVDVAAQVGRTFHVFDWTGVTPDLALTINSSYEWDLSHLNTTGDITLAAVPEPSTLALCAIGIAGLAALRMRRRDSARR